MKRLALLDLDETLIDEHYRLNCDEKRVQEAVDACAARDIVVGLCSDSALPTLQYWAERLGVDGPIVFEKGAGVLCPATGEQFILAPEATGWFGEFRRRFVLQMFPRLPEWAVFMGDNTAFIGQQGRFPGAARYAALISGIRAHSFGVHIRRIEDTDGQLVIDPDALVSVCDEAITLARALTKEELDVDANPDCGILIIHAKRTEKRNGIRFLLERERYDFLAMVGDSPSDFMDDPRVIQYAVGNASVEYQEKCEYVASATYTTSVVEILQYLAARYA